MKNSKCSKEANRLKEEGNKLFVAGKFHQSLERYNRALLRVDQEDEARSFSLILANRSAVLFKLKEYQMCLDDIKISLDHHYPSRLAYKLYDRRARCFYFLGDKNNFLEVLDVMEKMNLDDDDDAKRKLDKMVEELKQLNAEKLLPKKMKRKRMSKTKCEHVNSHFEGLSSSLEMRESRERGRFMVAREDIPAGTVLGAEDPVASTVLPGQRSSLCSLCFSRLVLTFLPCAECEAKFCSLACWETARTGSHRLECGLQTDLASLLTAVKGGEAPPQYYQLCLMTIGELSVEDVMEVDISQPVDMRTVPHQREGKLLSLFNLVR